MLTTTMIAAATLLISAPAKVDDYFENCDYHYGERQEQTLRYHLFAPREVNPNKRYPMLVWLYQAGNVTPGFLAFVFRDLEHIEKYQFFLVAIQYPSTDPSWFHTVGAKNYREADAALVAEIVHKLVRERPVNEDRVCASGASAGGGRCWEVAVRQPELFSAVIPLASGSNDMALAANLVNTPIWAFHNQGDVGSPVKNVQVMVEAVKVAGGNAHLTVFPQPGHDAWTLPYRDYDILTWMFAQRRGARICWVPPNTSPWKWRHILAEPCMFFGIVGVGWYLERTRRLRKKRCPINRCENTSEQFGACLDQVTSRLETGGRKIDCLPRSLMTPQPSNRIADGQLRLHRRNAMSLSEETEMLLSQLVDHELPVDRANEVLADVLDNAEARQRLKDMLQLRRLLARGRRQRPIAARPIVGS